MPTRHTTETPGSHFLRVVKAARPGVNTPGRAVLTCTPYGVGTSNANAIPAPIEIANRLMRVCHDSCVNITLTPITRAKMKPMSIMLDARIEHSSP